MATIEDLVERIKYIENILNLVLSQIDKLLSDIDKQIDIKMKAAEREILRNFKTDFEEQIQKFEEEVQKNFKTDFDEQIQRIEVEVRENINDYFLNYIKYIQGMLKEVNQIGKYSTDNIIVDREIKSKIADYFQKSGKVANQEKESEGKISLLKATEEFEREIILDALKRANYIQSHAAEMLGISRRILKYKMDKLDIRSGNNL